MIARRRLMAGVAALALLASACGVTDVIGYRALAECTGSACTPPPDASEPEPDSGLDASEPERGERVESDPGSMGAGVPIRLQ